MIKIDNTELMAWIEELKVWQKGMAARVDKLESIGFDPASVKLGPNPNETFLVGNTSPPENLDLLQAVNEILDNWTGELTEALREREIVESCLDEEDLRISLERNVTINVLGVCIDDLTTTLIKLGLRAKK